jgi:ubiquinone/menaquinone biosynthesis C-methylase UbiE
MWEEGTYMSDTSLSEFGKIDRTGDPGAFVRFLDAACAHESFQAYKQHLLTCLNLGPGSQVLDIGCGTGDDVRDMASVVAPGGVCVGVDNSRAMIDEARRRAGANSGIEFHVAEASALPFADSKFDASRADRSLMHVPEPRRALAEMIRVTRPGGRVVVFEVDFGTVVIDTDERELAGKIIRTWSDSLRDSWLGRRFPALFADQGLQEIRVVPHVLVLTPALALPIIGSATVARAVQASEVTRAEADRWLRHLDDLQQRGRFFAALTGFLVAGTR